jgi:multidrug efflux pump subunit AcrA (membrane-fusion protein)
MKPITIIIIVVIVLGLLGGAGYYGYQSSRVQDANIPQAPPTVAVTTCDVQSSVTATGDLVNTNQVTLQMPATGQLAEVSVHPGDHVSKGQVLASLADREKFTAAVSAAQLALAQAQQDYQDLIDNAASAAAQAQVDVANAQIAGADAQKKVAAANYPHSTDPLVIEKAQTDYLLAKAAYKDALSAYRDVAHKKLTNPERVQALSRLVAAETDMKTKFATYNWYLLKPDQNSVDQANAELAQAQAQLSDAQARWDKLKNGPDPLQLQSDSAKVNDAQAQLAEAQKTLDEVDIKAPFDGVVLSVNAAAGDSLQEGAPLISLNDPRAVEVEGTVTEEDMPNIHVGLAAQVYFDAYPDLQVNARLSRIVPVRVSGSDQPLYTVDLTLDQAPPELLSGNLVAGMTADASIITAQVKNVLCMPRSVVRASAGNTTTVKVWTGTQEENREIQVGLRGDTNIEIKSGLSKGDQVVAQ